MRIDFAAIESELEVIQKQLARLPMRRELAGTALGIIVATMMLTTLSLLFFLRESINLTLGACAGGRLGVRFADIRPGFLRELSDCSANAGTALRKILIFGNHGVPLNGK